MQRLQIADAGITSDVVRVGQAITDIVICSLYAWRAGYFDDDAIDCLRLHSTIGLLPIHRPPKNCAKLFFVCQNFVIFPPTLIIFLHKDGKESKMQMTHRSFCLSVHLISSPVLLTYRMS